MLKNDTNLDSASLQAQVVSQPQHGALDLKPDGGFTYTPAPSYSGTDTFTYRASDGSATSSPATVTIAVTPSRCAPRATVQIATAVVGGKLQATVEALPLDGQTNNRLREIRFGEMQNGKVTLNGQTVASGAAYIVPGTSTQVVFTVERATPGQATTVPITAVDECGSWPSFVGGGRGRVLNVGDRRSVLGDGLTSRVPPTPAPQPHHLRSGVTTSFQSQRAPSAVYGCGQV